MVIDLKSKEFWLAVLKIILFLGALYLSYLILKPLLFFLLGIGFWLLRILIYIAVAILVVHLFLRLIFKVNLLDKFLKKWKK